MNLKRIEEGLNMKTGILITNIGTPASYDKKDVSRYLKKFLMDEDIIDIPFIFRWILVNLIIVPRRAIYSANNYKKVWLDDGSPLFVYSQKFAEGLQISLGGNYVVQLGMSFSEPSIENGLKKLASSGVDNIIIAPMYPQFAQVTTGSTTKDALRAISKLGIKLPTKFLPAFYAEKEFLSPIVRIANEVLKKSTPDHWLFSFHGLPESQILKNPNCQLSTSCCISSSGCVQNCYKAHCLKTATELVKMLNIPDNMWSLSFQSRLGRKEWIKPYTEETVILLAKQGVKHLAVLSPSFVVDCIETIEEIGMGINEQFIEHGGQKMTLVPCLNADQEWINGFAEIIKRT